MNGRIQAMNGLNFKLNSQKGNARAGELTTEHGLVQTPIFMPVGTLATVKALDSQDIASTNPEIILANTYHLYLRPGMEVINKAEGVHNFMKHQGPMLTDSGGFQVFSLGQQAAGKGQEAIAKISDEGVKFKSHLDGSEHFFTPEKSIEIQRQIGADIIMTFDECTPDQADEKYTREALDRTHRWAKQCKDYWEKNERKSAYGKYQSLFGIVQGAMHPELRKESLQAILDLDFDGIAFGGETVGYNMEGTTQILDWVRDILPDNKPRYAMGLGRDPQNIVDAVLAGYDMFDCVAPTRLARNGSIYFGELVIENGLPKFVSPYNKGRMQIGNSEFKFDQKPISDNCGCSTCRNGYSRAYLRHLYKADELTYYRLSSIHNVYFMVNLSKQLRSWILEKKSD
jgi:queuine tRNA-ribosyltransferase